MLGRNDNETTTGLITAISFHEMWNCSRSVQVGPSESKASLDTNPKILCRQEGCQRVVDVSYTCRI